MKVLSKDLRLTGLFMTFEGGEGSGKTTQVQRLADALSDKGHTVLVTREPGGTAGADIVRELVLSGAAVDFGNDVEAALFAAARADHVAGVIAPAIARGEIVICDRFHDSTRVYQGRADNAAYLAALERAALRGTHPALTFILDVPAETGLQRAASRRGPSAADRFEAEDLALHEGRRQAFLEIASREPARCRVIDASRGGDQIAGEILSQVLDHLARRKS